MSIMFMKLGSREEVGLDAPCRSLPTEILYSTAAQTLRIVSHYKGKAIFLGEQDQTWFLKN